MVRLRLALAALLVAVTSLELQAQPRVVMSGRGPEAAGSPTATMSFDLGTLSVEWLAPTPWIEPLFTSDGRYLVAVPSPAAMLSQLLIRDQVGGWVSVVPLDGHVARKVLAHPRRLELFALMTDGLVASITTEGLRPLDTCTDSKGMDLSGDGRRLVLVCDHDIVVLDSGSGAQIARFDSLAQSVGSPVASFDGSRVLVVQFVVGNNLAVWDVATETRVVQDISPPLSWSEHMDLNAVVATTPGRDAVLVGTSIFFIVGNYGHRALLVDFSTLVVRQALPLVGPGVCKRGVSSGCLGLTTAAFTADGRHVVAGGSDSSATPKTRVQIAEVATNTLVASTDAGFFASDGVSLTLSSAPLPPEAVTSQVNGRDVTVSWSLPATSPDVTAYVLEAGSGPGLANLAVMCVPGDETSIIVAGVPPGRYYVRLRGRNVTGLGEASTGIVVNVS
jgi:hypothetical protein